MAAGGKDIAAVDEDGALSDKADRAHLRATARPGRAGHGEELGGVDYEGAHQRGAGVRL